MKFAKSFFFLTSSLKIILNKSLRKFTEYKIADVCSSFLISSIHRRLFFEMGLPLLSNTTVVASRNAQKQRMNGTETRILYPFLYYIIIIIIIIHPPNTLFVFHLACSFSSTTALDLCQEDNFVRNLFFGGKPNLPLLSVVRVLPPIHAPYYVLLLFGVKLRSASQSILPSFRCLWTTLLLAIINCE